MFKNKIHEWINTALIAVLLIVGLVGFSNNQPNTGADVYNTRYPHGLNVTADGCYAVDGTCVIDSSGNYDGAITGTTITASGATILDELTQGGSVLATSTTATAITFIASDLLTYSTWEVTPNTASLTYTFPASSTLSALVPTAGDSRTWQIYNATTTSGIDVIFAAGTGSEIKGAGGGSLTIDEASFGSFTLTRKANSDITIITNFPTAD